jgi:hypothetical protein
MPPPPAASRRHRRRQLLVARPRDALNTGGCKMQLAPRPPDDLGILSKSQRSNRCMAGTRRELRRQFPSLPDSLQFRCNFLQFVGGGQDQELP